MAEQAYQVDFIGYLRESYIDDLPTYEGIYCVFASTYDEEKNELVLHQLIYIGKSDGKSGIRGRISGHEKWTDWKSHLRESDEIYFSYAEVDQSYIERVEAAYINAHKPPENIEYTNHFPFDRTVINGKGKLFLLKESFTVNRH